eukprot:768701-Hanusia_phi.AAC.4
MPGLLRGEAEEVTCLVSRRQAHMAPAQRALLGVVSSSDKLGEASEAELAVTDRHLRGEGRRSDAVGDAELTCGVAAPCEGEALGTEEESVLVAALDLARAEGGEGPQLHREEAQL